MDASLLKKLPPELRNSIHEYLVCEHESIHLNLAGLIIPMDAYGRPRTCSLNLAYTCKELSRECLAVFYSRNRFVITADVLIGCYCFPKDCIGVIKEARTFGYTLTGWLQSLGESLRFLHGAELYIGEWMLYEDRSTRTRDDHQEACVFKAITHYKRVLKDSQTAFVISMKVQWRGICYAADSDYEHVDLKLALSSLTACKLAVAKALTDAEGTLALEPWMAKEVDRRQALQPLREKLYGLLSRLEAESILETGT